MLRALSVCLLALAMTAPAAAQGRVAGTIKDSQGRPIKGATILAENPSGIPSSATATSDAKGHFAFLGLRGTGSWTFRAEAPGFLPAVSASPVRVLGQNGAIDLTLQTAPQLGSAGPMANIDAAALQRRLTAAGDLARDGRIDDALEAYRDIARQLPALTSVHLEIGALLEAKHDAAGAVAEYQAALKGDPSNVKARTALDRLARQ